MRIVRIQVSTSGTCGVRSCMRAIRTIGNVYGRYTVVSEAPKQNAHRMVAFALIAWSQFDAMQLERSALAGVYLEDWNQR